MLWYYTRNREQMGPVEQDELFRLAREGAFAPQDLVWNETMGEQWVAASTIAGLFDASSTSLATTAAPEPDAERYNAAGDGGTGGATPNAELMQRARESLSGRWGLGAGAWVLYGLIGIAISLVPVLGNIASLLITGPLVVGLHGLFLAISRREEAEIGQLFSGFNRFGTALGAYLLMVLFILLWMLLLIIPGIIASLAYSMTFFIIADDASIGPLEALRRSKDMMLGNKWKYFCLGFRFFGWALLCLLTLGIGYIWLGPYMQTSYAHFYDDIRSGGQPGGPA